VVRQIKEIDQGGLFDRMNAAITRKREIVEYYVLRAATRGQGITRKKTRKERDRFFSTGRETLKNARKNLPVKRVQLKGRPGQ